MSSPNPLPSDARVSVASGPAAAERPLVPVIHVQNLSCFYGHHKAVEGVYMDIYQGQVTAIIGPSGCGKSTFLKTLNRIGEMESNLRIQGKVELQGKNIYARGTNLNQLRRQVGMIFQQPNPFAMSIYDNVAYGIRTIGRPSRSVLNDAVESALRSAALWDEVKDSLNRSGLELSGGQQQRLCIARALAVNPKVLLMDEPCSALDPIATMKIEELIHALKGKLTIAIVTHNMQQASRVSEHTAFFSVDERRVGQLVEFGPTSQIFLEAEQPSTRDYVAGRFG
ncbi:phosphate ABC transporter ATP-binding protein PstB [Altericista sp. CCNU0014]|uniref:phosphate ABC transporter ATP-binding protein PstB n=1 Tax=Altericista sp. CCNU0014 TaxID=3082949 RepID=UPI00384CBDCB